MAGEHKSASLLGLSVEIRAQILGYLLPRWKSKIHTLWCGRDGARFGE